MKPIIIVVCRCKYFQPPLGGGRSVRLDGDAPKKKSLPFQPKPLPFVTRKSLSVPPVQPKSLPKPSIRRKVLLILTFTIKKVFFTFNQKNFHFQPKSPFFKNKAITLNKKGASSTEKKVIFTQKASILSAEHQSRNLENRNALYQKLRNLTFKSMAGGRAGVGGVTNKHRKYPSWWLEESHF